MSSGLIRFGIVGAGMMGREHIRNLALAEGACVTALADPVRDSLDRSIREIGATPHTVSTFNTVEDMLAANVVDAVIVASPNYTHRSVLGPLFDSNVHVLCEKPLCTRVDDARWAADRAARFRPVFWTAMEYRYMPPVSHLVDRVRRGDIGKLVQLSIREHRFPFLKKVGDWNRFSRNTGGTMVEKCCHFFDLMRLIVGSDAVRVYCSAGMDVNHLDEKYGGQTPDIVDNAFAIVDFANGVRAMLDLCMFAEGSEDQEAIAAVGDKAKLEAFVPSSSVVLSRRVPLGAPKQIERTVVKVDAAALSAGTHHGAVFYQLQAFLEAVRGSGAVGVSALDGLRAVEIGVAAELSASERRVVEMAEII